MEEVVGAFWHRLVTRHASTEYYDMRIELLELQNQLGPFYRALGGSSGKVIEAAAPRKFNADRNFLQRIAGTHKRLCVAWQDERSVRLAPYVAFFNTKILNEKLYFWQVAMAAYLPVVNYWFTDNQRASLEIISERPGLKLIYHELVEDIIQQRPNLEKLEGDKLARELAIRKALRDPGSVKHLPEALGDVYPIPLWLYPETLHGFQAPSSDDEDALVSSRSGMQKIKTARRDAQRTDDAKKTDGLLVFMLESLLSWTEHVNLDRPKQDNEEENLQSALEDLDVITLSRQRRAGAARLKFDLDLPSAQHDDLAVGDGIKFPEWDYRKSRFIEDYCLLQPMLADDALPQGVPENLKPMVNQVRKRFSALQFQYNWLRRQPFGSELDLDACLEWMTESTKTDKQNLFKKRCLNERDISCLLLADLSMSTDAGINADQRVIDVIRDSIFVFSEALLEAGDPFAVYGFSSIKNKQVRFHLVKNFAEKYSDAVRGRILSIKPGFYTRMGAAIRQATQILQQQASQQRLLLIISDGKPNDIDHYEGRYGIEDTRKAILEAKQLGLQPFCITIDEEGSDYLPYLFGDQGFSIIKDITRLPSLLPKLYLNLTGLK